MGNNAGWGVKETEKNEKTVINTSDKYPDVGKLSRAEPDTKITLMCYGDKGDGKTSCVMSITGSQIVLSFDRKSILTLNNLYSHRKNEIEVYDAVTEYVRNPEFIRESSEHSIQQIINTLNDIKSRETRPDWIVIDGLEVLQVMAEMTMRLHGGVLPTQGISNLNLWKERKAILSDIHNNAMSASKKGVIYTTYTKLDTIIDDGNVKVQKKIPSWIDQIMMETDIVVRMDPRETTNGKEFWAVVESSKLDNVLKTGSRHNITNSKLPLKVS